MVVLTLAAVELFVRTDLFYELTPDSQAQEPIEIADLGFSLIKDPEVIVLGNSLTRNAISSFEMTKSAGAAEHFLVNLSQSNGHMSDYVWIYKLYRDKFRQADTLVIGIDVRSFDDAEESQTATFPRFRRYASLTQRLSFNDWSERISLVAGFIWKTWDGREQIRRYISDILYLQFERSGKPEIDEIGRFAIPPPRRSTDVNDIANYAKNNYIFVKGARFEEFAELVRMAEDDSLKIVLLEAPATNVYLDQLSINIGDEIGRLYRSIEEETGTGIIQIRLTEDDCPTIDTCFTDYGHMNVNGSKIYSRLLQEYLGNVQPSGRTPPR